MDWATIRGGAPYLLSQPDETLEEFLVRVGVPPAYRVDLSPARSAVRLALEPSFDLASRTWTWSLEETHRTAKRLAASWTLGSATVDEMAGEVVAAARNALVVRSGEPMTLECVRSGARPFERLADETDEGLVERAIDTIHRGEWLEIGADFDERSPCARLDVLYPSEIALQWLAPLVGGGPPRQTIKEWPKQRSAVVGRVVLEIRRALAVPPGRQLVLWRGDAKRLVPVKGDELEMVAAVLAIPDRWASCWMEAPALRPTLLPRLGRSGPGSGMDEIEALGDAASERPARLHLLWWEGDLKHERSWLLAEPSIDRSVALEVGSAVRGILGLHETAPVRAEAIPVGGPDGAAIEAAQDELMYNALFGALLGSVIGIVGTLVLGLITAINVSALTGILTVACGVVAAIVVGIGTFLIGEPLSISLMERLIPSQAARVRAFKSRMVRAVLITSSVVIPAIASIAAAIAVGRAVSAT